ncbi:TonB family protein [Piscinibacter terrae]|uniref:TonB family protein n=1 Tax=Piscinibacter terrae TaxID=2496871 RepID=A0A3N7JW51_9BURK|nr:TonB family protein [Albitalea terrae]RQP23105.1 TonB family protein [Albitalea terrae]
MRGFQRIQEEADETNRIGDVRLAALAAALLATVGIASAQPASAPATPAAMSERVMRDADSPFRWIKIQAETVRKAAAPVPAPAPAPTVVAAPPPPAPKTASAKPSAAASRPVRLAAANIPSEQVASSPPTASPLPAAVTAPKLEQIEQLVNIDRADPEWDEDLMRTLRKGRVVVRFNVAEDGYLSRIQIVESTNSRLTGPVMGAVMQWRFQPISEPQVATVEFGFDLDSGRR